MIDEQHPDLSANTIADLIQMIFHFEKCQKSTLILDLPVRGHMQKCLKLKLLELVVLLSKN